MIDAESIPPIADNELLARFILNSNGKRDDGNVNHKHFHAVQVDRVIVLCSRLRGSIVRFVDQDHVGNLHRFPADQRLGVPSESAET